MKSTINLFIIVVFTLISGRLHSQSICSFEITDTLYSDTAYIYKIYDSTRYEYYIDFSSNLIKERDDVLKKIKNGECRIYFYSLSLEGLIIKSGRYNLNPIYLENFYNKNEIYKSENMEVELITNKLGYVLYRINGEESNELGHYHRKRYKKTDCLNICSIVSGNCEIEIKIK